MAKDEIVKIPKSLTTRDAAGFVYQVRPNESDAMR